MKRLLRWVGLLMVLGGLAPGVHATSSPKVTVQLIITNAQGSVVAKMTPDGVPTYSAEYRPYGTTQSTPQAGPGYTGHVMDPTSGLVYMQQRYYDSAVGRFISPDPVAPTPGNVFNFGRFTYANDNPIRFTDPDGRYPGAKDNPCSNATCKRKRQIQKQNKWVRDSGGSVIIYAPMTARDRNDDTSGNVADFWESRYGDTHGGAWSRIGLAEWDPNDPRVTKWEEFEALLTQERLINALFNRDLFLAISGKSVPGVGMEVHQIGVDIMHKFVITVTHNGGYTPNIAQGNTIHYQVFMAHGLPRSTYGATPIALPPVGVGRAIDTDEAKAMNAIFHYCGPGC